MNPINAARQAKHRAFVLRRRLARCYRQTRSAVFSRTHRYRFDPANYPLSFVALPQPLPPEMGPMDGAVPRRIFVLWTAHNPMTPARVASLATIRRLNPELDVVLVTPDNLDDFIVDASPLHPAYHDLSAVHRSDYLRSYLLHHHGGGYSDIKAHRFPWAPAFDKLENDPERWIAGYPVPSVDEAAKVDGPIGRDIHRYYRQLIGTGAMIARAGSALTHEWSTEANRRMDYYQRLLAAAPGNTWGDNPGYPVPWTALGSQILEPLSLKYLPRIQLDDAVRPHLSGHR